MPARVESIEELIWEVRRTFRDVAAAADQELGALGIQASQRALLEFLVRETEPISISELARKHAVSRQHVHQTLRGLAHPEWVEETSHPADARTVLVRLSRAGRAFWQRVRAVDRLLLQRLAGPLSQERVVEAADLLRRLRRHLREEERDDERG